MEFPERDEGDGPVVLGDQFSEFEPAPLVVGPDGIPVLPVVGLPPPAPAPTPQNWICLRGPCRHYLHLVGTADVGNPVETLPSGRAPRMRYDYCRAIPGTYIDMGDDVVSTCNRWDPEDPDDLEILARDRRREKHLALHPEYASAATDNEWRDWLPDDDELGEPDGGRTEERDRGPEAGAEAGAEGQVPGGQS